jgi:kinesin family protein 22
MEIYKDEVYDLLVSREKVRNKSAYITVFLMQPLQANKLPVRENDAGQVFVANLSALPIASEREFTDIYR